jgi:predicted HicB family RNase H-like nuclease
MKTKQMTKRTATMQRDTANTHDMKKKKKEQGRESEREHEDSFQMRTTETAHTFAYTHAEKKKASPYGVQAVTKTKCG